MRLVWKTIREFKGQFILQTLHFSFWTFIAVISFIWNKHQIEEYAFRMAYEKANQSFQSDILFRHWLSEQGGIYVRVNHENQPVKLLGKIPDRDIDSDDGARLTMINPNSLMNVVYEPEYKRSGVKSHITSLEPLCPNNTPDEWEKNCINEFMKGKKETINISYSNGQKQLRVMKPLFADSGCLKCHGFSNYSSGDIMGGISVSVPIEDKEQSHNNLMLWLFGWHLFFWASGSIIIFFQVKQNGEKIGESSSDTSEKISLNRNSDLIQQLAQIGSFRMIVASGEIELSTNASIILSFHPADRVTIDDLIKITHEDDRNKADLLLRNTPSSLSQITEMRIVSGGTLKWVSIATEIEYGDQSEPLFIIGVVRDITECKKTEDIFHLNEARLECLIRINDFVEKDLKSILDFALESAITLTRSKIGYIYFYSEEKREFTLFSWSKEAMEDCKIAEPQTVYSLEKTGLWGEAVRQRRPIIMNDYKAPNIHKRGYPQGHVELNRFLTIPVIIGGSIKGVAGVANKDDDYDQSDIRQLNLLMDSLWGIIEKKKTEEQQKMLEHQLVHAQKMESIGRLAGGVAHDFNNMLTPILGYSEMIMTEIDDNHPFKDLANEIHKAASKSRDLTRQLLAFARRQTLEMNPLNLNSIILDFEKIIKRTIREDIEIELFLTEPLGLFMGDNGQIEQIIMNLVINAQDAMPGGGKLIIETSEITLDEAYAQNFRQDVIPGTYILLSVTDTGSGMEKEIAERIFEPFFTTKENGKGTGLGLSTVHGIVKQHDGNIWLYSEPGQGTTFRIYFPKRNISEFHKQEKAEPDSECSGSETILVVEDNEQVRTMACWLLRRCGYNVHEAGDPNTAIDKAEKHKEKIDLLITDVIMPEMNGKTLSEKIKSIHKEAKILYMSGYPANVIGHHGVLEKNINFIQKPFTIKEFKEKVRLVLSARNGP